MKRIRNLRLEQTLNSQEVLKEDFQITVKGLTVKGSELIALDIEMEDE